jgi:hypothetical protein
MAAYRTRDLSFAAFLVVSGHSIQITEREGRRVWFVFDLEPDALKEIEHDWLSGGEVPARSFAETIRSIKSIVHREE